MTESANTKVVALLQSLSKKFDALYKDVERVKEKDARRSMSNSEAETSDNARDSPTETDAASKDAGGSTRRSKKTTRSFRRPRSPSVH